MKADVHTFLSIDSGTSKSILNSLKDQICLIDSTGKICFVNEEWNRFNLSNGGTLSSGGIGANYLQQCENESVVYQGLQEILAEKSDCFNYEYPCHSLSVKRWFLMQATPFKANQGAVEGVVIRHVDITKQKLLELQLQEYAEKDPLTSLYNRRYFETQIKKEGTLARQKGTRLGLLYIDTDNFKEINDAYGHPAGDRVLEELSLQIKQVIRSSDTAARIGGDEFAILFPDTDQIQLECIANRLSQNIQEQNRSIDVTVSIGGKSFIDDYSPNSMIKWVDKALYAAKDKGKNQVVLL